MRTKEKIVIIGSSGHAKVIIDIIEQEGKFKIIGLIDTFKGIGESVLGYKIIGEDKVEELDLVGSWELIGLLAEMKLCEPPKLISLNSMNPSGEHGMRFNADIHFTENILVFRKNQEHTCLVYIIQIS
mgnify:CR=1 FL=1